MAYLEGLKEYIDANYEVSIFDTALKSGNPWKIHLHGNRSRIARVLENRKWALTLEAEEGQEDVEKIQIAFLYPADLAESIGALLKTDKKVQAMGMEPILAPGKRYFVKNKSLFPLMKEREVLFFTLLDGKIIRGVVTDFSRYDTTVNLKGGLPVTILRHAIYDVRNKKGRSFLKSSQEKYRGWEKSPLFVEG
jgi:hypothetical protein